MKGAIVVLSWAISASGVATALTMALADGSVSADQINHLATQINSVLDAREAGGGLGWKGVAVWLAGINGVLWNPWVQRILHVLTDVGERWAHEQTIKDKPPPARSASLMSRSRWTPNQRAERGDA